MLDAPAPALVWGSDVDEAALAVARAARYPASAVTEAYVTGQPVTALCGKRWVPTRDPKRYPVCPTCKEILEQARSLRGNG